MPYGGNFQAVGGFVFFGGNDFGGSGKPKYGGIFDGKKQYGGNFLAVGGFSFFGCNDFGESGKTKIWRYFFGGNAIRR